ncbi:hypothetical protein MLD38_007440 [Melastoma candidum]|uniref:Uncharacterized protein n=1 Tax=Melastoma candidum TaxID=119954 RepID=A0ACB9RSD8_9MYRT|nr:hypothetical protein MLD38_007440 [Melastoma candidum]
MPAAFLNLVCMKWGSVSLDSCRPRSAVICTMKPGVDSNSATGSPATEIGKSGSRTRRGHGNISPSNPRLEQGRLSGLVLELGPNGSWDGAMVGSPVVKRYIGDNEERWYMLYQGRCKEGAEDGNPIDSIGLAVSRNGIHWTRGADTIRSCSDAGMVMSCRDDWWAFDTRSIRPSELVVMSSPMYSSVYWLYYMGQSDEKIDLSGVVGIEQGSREGLKCLPGLACSQDGRNWARIEGDHHSGAILDTGSEGEWDSLFIADPHVVIHEDGDLRMYYCSYDRANGEYGIGLARSRDGIRWVKLGKIMGGSGLGCFDEKGARSACVVQSRRDGGYVMAYEGVDGNGRRAIGIAVSRDGLRGWERLQEGPVLVGSEEEGGWDNGGVGGPCLVEMEGGWRLFYEGVSKEGRTGIGMAVSEGHSLGKFKRWTGLCL